MISIDKKTANKLSDNEDMGFYNEMGCSINSATEFVIKVEDDTYFLSHISEYKGV